MLDSYLTFPKAFINYIAQYGHPLVPDNPEEVQIEFEKGGKKKKRK